jgi:hypothetical protein
MLRHLVTTWDFLRTKIARHWASLGYNTRKESRLFFRGGPSLLVLGTWSASPGAESPCPNYGWCCDAACLPVLTPAKKII